MAAEATPQTKKIINPRVEIDTSPPFESVKEAVNLFGGRSSAPWSTQQLLPPLDVVEHNYREVIDINKMEEQAARLERVLITRERETLNVLRELEDAKSLMEGLKVNLMQGQTSPVLNPDDSVSSRVEAPSLSPPPPAIPGSVLTNFDKATANLNKTAVDLSVIRASVESLNKIMSREKGFIERSNEAKFTNSPAAVPIAENRRTCRAALGVDDKEEIKLGGENSAALSYEAEQFRKMVEASRYEILQAMSEIERTKVSIRMAEMRLHAARKIEEAAKAVEAIAVSDTKALQKGENSPEQLLACPHKPEEITLSYEEYNALSYKAKQADQMCRTMFVDAKNAAAYKERFKKNSLEAAFTHEGDDDNDDDNDVDGFRFDSGRFKLGNNSYLLPGDDESNGSGGKNVPFYRSTISIGDILTRKLILQKDIRVDKHVEKRQRSLSQLLREQSGVMLHRSRSTKEGSVEQHFVARKKKFGFIRVPLSKNNKKTQARTS